MNESIKQHAAVRQSKLGKQATLLENNLEWVTKPAAADEAGGRRRMRTLAVSAVTGNCVCVPNLIFSIGAKEAMGQFHPSYKKKFSNQGEVAYGIYLQFVS